MRTRFKMEFGVSLTGAIAGIAAFVYSLLLGIRYYKVHSFTDYYVIIALALMLLAIILAFIGAGLLAGSRKAGGVLLVISGLMMPAAALLTFDIAWAGLLVFAMMMLPGVMALSKRSVSGKAPFNQTYINSFDGLK